MSTDASTDATPLTAPIVSAVIFDMDGLMLDTERIAQAAWQRAGTEYGYTLPDAIYLQAIGRTAPATEVLFRGHLGQDAPFEAIYRRKQQYYHEAIEQGRVPTGLAQSGGHLDRAATRRAKAPRDRAL